jgi:uncharacterized membrane protein
MVEALTIVLASGLARGWRSSLTGVGAATLALAIVVAALGPALTLIPIDALRLVVGGLLLTFGLQWLRKAILRASGFKALHDEDAIFARELREAETAPRDERAGIDWYGFTLSFKGVFLEGLEVAFIVLTFGSTQKNIPLAALGAAVAVVLVAVVGVLARAPLARVPENTMKFAVGVMLTTFGIFWGAEGAGASNWCRHEPHRRLRSVLVGLRGGRRLGRRRGRDRRPRAHGRTRRVVAAADRCRDRAHAVRASRGALNA